MSGRLDEVLDQLRETVAALHGQIEHSTATSAELMSQMRNGVLFSGSGSLDQIGQWSTEVRAPYAAVVVHNTSAHTITVHNAAKGQPPAAGVSVWSIPPGVSVTCPLAGTAVTLYGTAGDTFNVALLARVPGAVGRTA